MRGSIKRRAKGSWRLVFDLERDHTGRRRQKPATFRGTKKAAEAELADQIAKIKNGGFVEPHKLTVAKYLERWLKNRVKDNTGAKTFERYSEICRNHLTPALGEHKLSKLTPLHIQDCYAEARAQGRRDGKGGLSARTVLHHHRILRQALKQAVKWRLITYDPTDAVEAPTPTAKEIETLDEAQTATFLEGAEGTSLYLPILLAVTTGLRRGEMLALRWKHIDLDRNTLSVVESLEETRDGGLQFKTPKTKGSRRSVTLPSITVEALQRHKVEQAQIRLRLGLGRDDDALVYGRFDGSPRSPRAFTKEFSRFVAKLRAETQEDPERPDVPPVTFHGLRHSHATQLLKAGIHPKIAQERLGHSTIAVTLDLYSHVTKTMQDDAARRVDAALRLAINERTNGKH